MTKAPRGGLRSTVDYLGEGGLSRRRKDSMLRAWALGLMVRGGKLALLVGFLILWTSDWFNR